MGHWFGKSKASNTWRKTPAKINNNWYTPSGEKIYNPDAYFKAVRKNGEYWTGDTGWSPSNTR